MADNSAFGSIKMLPKQIRQTLEDIGKLKIGHVPSIHSIAIAGMGASIYNYHVIHALFKNELSLPLIAVNEYGIPASVGKDTLFIASSYSGSTEEVVYNIKQAHERGAVCLAVTSGGELASYCKQNNIPLYQFDPTFNPSGQPRMGQGYMIFGAVGLLVRLGYLPKVSIDMLIDMEKMAITLKSNVQKMAEELSDVISVFVASEHLAGNVHIVRNQVNETAKSYADYHIIPELNHHVMEGLKNPKNKKLLFFFFESSLYSTRVQERFKLTIDVVEKNEVGVIRYTCQGKTRLAQVLEVLLLGGYLTYFLCEKYGENPNAIPWVDYFKEKLGKM